MKKHLRGGRPQLLHDRVSRLISFERDRLELFEQRCDASKISVSEGIRLLVERELKKKKIALEHIEGITKEQMSRFES